MEAASNGSDLPSKQEEDIRRRNMKKLKRKKEAISASQETRAFEKTTANWEGYEQWATSKGKRSYKDSHTYWLGWKQQE